MNNVSSLTNILVSAVHIFPFDTFALARCCSNEEIDLVIAKNV